MLDKIKMVHDGDKAEKEIFEALLPTVNKIARKAVAKYPWVCFDDLSQQMLLVVPAIIRRYKPEYSDSISFEKYAYHRLHFEAKDCLREQDPLGISWPQKSKENYPTFSRLSDDSMKFWEPSSNEEVYEEEEELSPLEQQLQDLQMWRDFMKTQPQPLPPSRQRKRRRKYKVPAEFAMSTYVEGLLGKRGRNFQQMSFF